MRIEEKRETETARRRIKEGQGVEKTRGKGDEGDGRAPLK